MSALNFVTATPTVSTTQTAGTSNTSIATTAFVAAAVPNSTYRNITQVAGSMTAGQVVGTYPLNQGGSAMVAIATGNAFPISTIYISSTDLPTVNGTTTKLRLRCQVHTNDVAPTATFTFGLYPVTRPGTSGGAGVAIYTLGTVTAGSTAVSTTPAADTSNNVVGSDFAIPADGFYAIAVETTTATLAASSHVHLIAHLQMHNA